MANTAGSDIQLLDLENMSTEPQKLPLPALTAVGRGDRDHIAILDSLLRERRHIIPTQNPRKIPSDRPPALCASLRNDTVVHRFEDGGREYLQS